MAGNGGIINIVNALRVSPKRLSMHLWLRMEGTSCCSVASVDDLLLCGQNILRDLLLIRATALSRPGCRNRRILQFLPFLSCMFIGQFCHLYILLVFNAGS